MLQIKQRPPETEELPPRWIIGVDRRNVAAYVGLALIAGLAVGFLAARFMTRNPASPRPLASETWPAARQASSDNQPSEFHRVTRIVRADTIDVESVGPVRMIGIETPDGKSPLEIYGVHGQRALSFVEKTLLSQEVRLEFDAPGGRTNDESGQTPAYVYTRDGTLINGEMVKQGLALVRSEQFKLANDFRGYEREAMQAMRGVWGSSSSSASALASTTTTTTTPPQPSAEDKPKKLSPLPPSAFGVNVPALSGSTSTPGEPSVWVSLGDKMYHKSGCEFLDKKKRSVGLSHAKSEGYTACSRCYASTVLKAP
ncbi:MAG: thermonuclease family protein [Acidobacteriota bacterium]